MKRILLAYTLSALCLLPAFAGGGEGALPISYVNPFIGTKWLNKLKRKDLLRVNCP